MFIQFSIGCMFVRMLIYEQDPKNPRDLRSGSYVKNDNLRTAVVVSVNEKVCYYYYCFF